MQEDDLRLLDRLIDDYKRQLHVKDLSPSRMTSTAASIRREIKNNIKPKLTPKIKMGIDGWLDLIDAQAERFGDSFRQLSDSEKAFFTSLDHAITRLICDPFVSLVMLQSEYRQDKIISKAISHCDIAFLPKFSPIILSNIFRAIEEQAQIIALGMLDPLLENCFGDALEQQFSLMPNNKLRELSQGFFSNNMARWIDALFAYINSKSTPATRNSRAIVKATHILKRFEIARTSLLIVLISRDSEQATLDRAERRYFPISGKRTYADLSQTEKEIIDSMIRHEISKDLLYKYHISLHVQLPYSGDDHVVETTAALTIIYARLGNPIKDAFAKLSEAFGFFSFNAQHFLQHLNCIDDLAGNIITIKPTESSKTLFHAPLGDCATPYIVVLQALLSKMMKQELEKFAEGLYGEKCENFYRALWATVYRGQYEDVLREKITRTILQLELLRENVDLVLIVRGLQPMNSPIKKNSRQFHQLTDDELPQKELCLVQEIIRKWETERVQLSAVGGELEDNNPSFAL